MNLPGRRGPCVKRRMIVNALQSEGGNKVARQNDSHQVLFTPIDHELGCSEETQLFSAVSGSQTNCKLAYIERRFVLQDQVASAMPVIRLEKDEHRSLY